MKKRLLFTILIGFAGFLGIANKEVNAEGMFSTDVEIDEKINLGITSSVVIPKDSTFGTGFQVQGLISYDVMKYIALGIEGGWTGGMDVESSGINFGTLNAGNILGDVILKLPVGVGKSTLVPYLVNGFGGVFPNFNESSTLKDSGIKVDYEASFIYKLGGGFDWYITKLLALSFEVSYQWSNLKGKAEMNGSEIASGTDRFDALYIGGGIKLKF